MNKKKISEKIADLQIVHLSLRDCGKKYDFETQSRKTNR